MEQSDLVNLERELVALIYPNSTIALNRRSMCWTVSDAQQPGGIMAVPKWSRSNDAAFSLMQREKCYPVAIIGGVSIEDVFCEKRLVVEEFASYGGDKDLATRVALVKGCIARRKIRNECKEGKSHADNAIPA